VAGKRISYIILTAIMGVALQDAGANQTLPLEAARRYIWSYATGWGEGILTEQRLQVVLTESGGYLSGRLWSENIGWISMGSTDQPGPYANQSAYDWGVNLSPDWELSGYAWAPSIGWVTFDHPLGARIHPQSGYFEGYARSDAIGPIRLGAAPDQGLTYGLGVNVPLADFSVPVWWYLANGFTNALGEIDSGAAGLDWRAFYEGTDPSSAVSRLAFTDIRARSSQFVDVTFPSQKRRMYRIDEASRLGSDEPAWDPIAFISGTGEEIMVSFPPAESAMQRYFRVEVQIAP